MKHKLYSIETLSPLHIGTGRGAGDIDLPVSRDPVTGHPDIPGSGLKGVTRDAFDVDNDKKPNYSQLQASFGSSSAHPDAASSVAFLDAALVCLPVRSYKGTVAYVASPLTLRKLRRLAERAGHNGLAGLHDFAALDAAETLQTAVTETSALVLEINLEGKVLLEDLDLDVTTDLYEQTTAAAKLLAIVKFGNDTSADAKDFIDRFTVIPSQVFDFLCETSLPVMTRNAVGENGIVKTGALWYEEQVSEGALFMGAIVADRGLGKYSHFTPENLLTVLSARPLIIQIGGKASTGRGLVNLSFHS